MEWRARDTTRARELRNQATPQERTLWRYLGASKLGHKFSRQMPIGPFFADFVCRGAKLVVELDGYSHDLSVEADARRDRYMQEQGFQVLRFSNEDVTTNVEGIVNTIAAALANRPPPSPSRKREGRR
ncbi:DUF559 domain-containing protein [Sphingomonas panacisoli]|uniref:DUF559 domain-containing protein n=1 Tax=Sphingomonas panacisoli TaxID=1813879 RepID=A0A5B8LMN7_9SPHN|nr:DUF559 domain-containing protein [Sphingomonas panacisoli]QDZ08945.1 DUF559 domain-containing protein [Sphingomonas panacisoli]